MTDTAISEAEIRALADIRPLRVQIEAPARVTSQEMTYRKDGRFSYIQDRWMAERRGDYAAQARLQRHAQEMDAWQMEEQRYPQPGVNPSPITGQGGYFDPPAWVIKDFATYPRPGRILSNLCKKFPLPKGVSTVNLPRMSAGNQEADGPPNAANGQSDVTDAAVESPVVQIDGQGDVAIQLIEMSPVGAAADWAWFQDLASSYDYVLEQQLIYGSGSATAASVTGQLPGILNLTSINAVTYTDASPTGKAMFPYLGQMMAQVGKNRYLPPECWLLSTSRWAWLESSEDSNLRPFEMPDLNGADNPLCPGAILGIPAWLDDAIPRTISTAGTAFTGGTADTIIALRPSDIFLFEGTPRLTSFDEVLSGTLEVRLIYRNYAAAITGRYPGGISWAIGTGMIVQSGF